MTDAPEERAGGLGAVSPLLGTRPAQAAVDALARNVERLNSGLTKAVNALQRTTGATGSSGWNGGSNFGHGRANGGGSTPAPYRPGQHWDQQFLGGGGGKGGTPTNQSGSRGNGGWGGRAAMAGTSMMVGAGISNMSNYVTANTTAQMLSRNSTVPWDTIRGTFTRNNVTATSMADASQAGATLGTLGYAAGSSRWNAAASYNRSFGRIDPSMGAGQVAAAQANMAAPGVFNYMQGRGINTIGPGGKVMDPGQMAHSIMAGKRVKDINHFMGATGGFQNVTASLRMAGASDDMIQALSSETRAQLTTQKNGLSYDGYRKAVAGGDTKTLERYGVNTTDATRLKTTAAKQRNVEDNMASGFSKGLDHATDALSAFATALDGLTHGPLGDSVGYGQGLGGTLASGGSSVLGAYMGARGVKAVGKAVLKGRGGAALGRGGGALLGRAGPLAARGAGAGATALGAIGGGSVAAGGAIVGAVGMLGYSAVHATTDHDERAARDAAFKEHGEKQHWYNNSWQTQFSNSMTFGLTDKIDAKLHPGSSDAGWNRSMGTDGMSGGASVAGGGGGGGSSKGKSGGAAPSAGGATAAKVIGIAMKYVGVPYVWGGTTPRGFDCSGLLQYSFKQAGVSLPRVSQDQMRVGTAVRMADVRPGDLVFPADGHHVAMVIGPGKIIEAPRTGLNVRVASLRSTFTVARRVLASVGSVGAITGDSATSVSGDNRSQKAMPAVGGNAGMAGAGTSEADIVASALGGSAGGASVGQAQSNDAKGSDGSTGNNGAGAAGGPPPSGNVGSWINKALGILHLDASKYGKALGTIIQHESSGNPRAINKTDSNWKAGHPSKGIMQTIDSTFNAHKMPGHGDIWNPVDNILAATRYALSRYGSMDNVPGIKSLNNGGAYKGYDVGSTNIDVDQIAKVHKGEMVLDAGNAEKVRAALAGNTPTKGLLGGSGGKVVLQFNDGAIRLHASGPMNDSAATDFAKQFVGILANTHELATIANG